ncbi:35915_t:CDS:2, partial [Gigaspora margarita]
ELESLQKKEIKENIDKRCEIIKDNQGKMLRSLLEKPYKKITLDRVFKQEEEWLEQLNAPVEMKKWYQMLKDLKSNKAPEISNISYIMLKQAVKKLIRF